MKYFILSIFLLGSFPVLAASKPVATPTSATTDEDVSVAIPLSGTDADSEALTFALSGAKTGGTVTLDSAGVATFKPTKDYYGTGSFKFKVTDASGSTSAAAATVTVTINPVNDAPKAQNIPLGTLSTEENTAITVDLTSYVSDVDGDAVTCQPSLRSDSITPKTSLGSISISSCLATFTPKTGKTGDGYFKYYATDSSGTASSEKTVYITINEVNHAPEAENMEVIAEEETSIDMPLQASDEDGDALTYTIKTSPENGTLTIDGTTATYIPTTDYTGDDSFTYIANDGVEDSEEAYVTIRVSPSLYNYGAKTKNTIFTQTNTEVDLVTVDSSVAIEFTNAPANGSVTTEVLIDSQIVLYKPETDYEGTDSFTFTLTNAAGETAEVQVAVIIRASPDEVDCSYITSKATSSYIYGKLYRDEVLVKSGKVIFKKIPIRRIQLSFINDSGATEYVNTDDNGCYIVSYDSAATAPNVVTFEMISKESSYKPDRYGEDEGRENCDGASWTIQYYGFSGNKLLSDVVLVGDNELNFEIGHFFSSYSPEEKFKMRLHRIGQVLTVFDTILDSMEFVCEGDAKANFDDISVTLSSDLGRKISAAYYVESQEIEISTLASLTSLEQVVGHEYFHHLQKIIYPGISDLANTVRDRGASDATIYYRWELPVDARIAFAEGSAEAFGNAVTALYSQFLEGRPIYSLILPDEKGITVPYNVSIALYETLVYDRFATAHGVFEKMAEGSLAFNTAHLWAYLYSTLSTSTAALKDGFESIGISEAAYADAYDSDNVIGTDFGHASSLYPQITFLPYKTLYYDDTRYGASTPYDYFVAKAEAEGTTFNPNPTMHDIVNVWADDAKAPAVAECNEGWAWRYVSEAASNPSNADFYYSGREDFSFWKDGTTTVDDLDDMVSTADPTGLIASLIQNDLTASYDAYAGNIIEFEFADNPPVSAGGSQWFRVNFDDEAYADLGCPGGTCVETTCGENYKVKRTFNIASHNSDPGHVMTLVIWKATSSGMSTEAAWTATGPYPEIKDMPVCSEEDGECAIIAEVYSAEEMTCFAPNDEHFCEGRSTTPTDTEEEEEEEEVVGEWECTSTRFGCERTWIPTTYECTYWEVSPGLCWMLAVTVVTEGHYEYGESYVVEEDTWTTGKYKDYCWTIGETTHEGDEPACTEEDHTSSSITDCKCIIFSDDVS